ncbi:MAG: EAL domain-containing protein [Pseudomonadales bacterium]|nr:EAL domain-containing protein [Pseudomonadales bacterium]
MTMLRQIMLVVVAIFLILFSANFFLTVYDSRLYLEQQMRMHAQDTATSLGLSMTTALGDEDSANLELLANAVFDRGYYQTITLQDTEGKILLERHNPLTIDGVPGWFLELIALPSPAGTSEIMSGWSILGQLTVIAHPGHAYRDLWRISSHFFYLFCIILSLSYLFIGLVLKIIMRPLTQVEILANNICERKFVVLDEIPRTRELRRVVQAMNRMSEKVRLMFQQQLKLTESLRNEARLDPVTGLTNRTEFDAVANAKVNAEEGPGSSILMIIQIRNFAAVNATIGHEQADLLLIQIAERITENLAPLHDAVISRRSGGNFAVFLNRISLERARVYLETTFRSIASLHFFTADTNLDAIHMGGSFHPTKTGLSTMLSAADSALLKAQSEGTNSTHFHIHGDQELPISTLVKQISEWKHHLNRTIETDGLLFYYQPVFSLPEQCQFAHEVFVRIELDGEIIDAGMFMPMAERFGLLVKLDQIIIEKVLRQLVDASPDFIINLSTRSIQNAEFIDWLIKLLAEFSHHGKKVIFELQEYSIHLAYDQVKRLIESGNTFGYRFSVDHFGSGATTFSYLQSLDLHFIKIDRSFITGICENTDNQFFIQSAVQIAHTRDMLLIAEGVELESELETLRSLGVDAVMGYFLGRPGPDY